MRLTVEHVRRAPQFTNTLLQREVDFRGLGISSLDEHALVLLDNKFDVINLTANALSCLEYFPLQSVSAQRDTRMHRVGTLIVHRNALQKVSVPSCVMAVPNVRCFLADGNSFYSVRSLLFLKHWKRLEIVSLERNPVLERNEEQFDEPRLRAFLVHLCPRLKLINYQRVTASDRDLAAQCAAEFRALARKWEPVASTGVVDGGKKVRKRGRDAPKLVADTDVAVSSAAHGEAAAPVGVDNGIATGSDAAHSLQERLDQIEARILSDDVTAEEIMALEQEMNELTAEMEMRKKRRKA